MFNLMTTLVLSYQNANKSSQAIDYQMLEPLLLISLGFCHTSKEVERLYTDEDKNAFLSTFSETIED